MAEPQTQNPLASIIQALLGQAQPRPDLTSQVDVNAPITVNNQSLLTPRNAPATFAGRVIRPGETPAQVLSRLPEGGAPGEEGAMAPVAALPSVLGETIGRLGMLGSLRNIAKGLKGKFQTAVVDKEGLPRVVYHGTPQVFGEFDINKSQPGLYGKGIYLTESPEVAGGTGQYSSRVGGTELGYATPRTVSDVTHITAAIREAKNELRGWEQSLKPERDIHIRDLQEKVSKLQAQLGRELNVRNPNVRPAFVDIRKPFDIDGPHSTSEILQIIRAAGKEIPSYKHPYGTLNGDEAYQYLRSILGTEHNVNAALQKAGYDGITHIGGAITGGAPHRVWIAFDPKQVRSAFDPELQSLSGWKPQAQGK